MAKITIDGKAYDTDEFSETARAELISIQFCDAELRQLQSEAATIQTARIAYLNALKTELERQEAPAPTNNAQATNINNFENLASIIDNPPSDLEQPITDVKPEKPKKKGKLLGGLLKN